jgi:hypothetical protein
MTKAKAKPKTPVKKKETAIEVYQTASLGALEVPMEEIIEKATEIATALNRIIEDKELFTEVRPGQKHVHVEGWETLGALTGIMAREAPKGVEKIPGGFQAHVELVRTRDGLVIGGASAICTADEKNWQSKPAYQLYSMALTRAVGKAYRISLSWVMTLAGYEVCPWEEMAGVVDALDVKVIEDDVEDEEEETLQGLVGTKEWPAEKAIALRTAMRNAKIIPGDSHDKQLLYIIDKSPFGINVPIKDFMLWAKLYRGYKEQTGDTDEAVRMATEAYGAGDPA